MNSKAPPSISAAKQRHLTKSARPEVKKRGGENVLWKRLTGSFDDAVRRLGANPEIATPVTRLVLFKHLTKTQGMAGRRYADIVRKMRRYHVAPQSDSPRAVNLEPARGSEDQEIERRIANGSIGEYEKAAKAARKQYDRLMKTMEKFKDPVTGRNFARDIVEELVLLDREPEANHRDDIGRVLTEVAKTFGISEQPRRRRR